MIQPAAVSILATWNEPKRFLSIYVFHSYRIKTEETEETEEKAEK